MILLRKLKEFFFTILKPTGISFRIINIFTDEEDKQIKVRYHVIGKQVTTVEPLQTIIKSLVHIQGFSPYDASLLLDAYNQLSERYPLSLKSILFDEEDSVVIVTDGLSNESFLLRISVIESNLEILRQFNEADYHAIMLLVFNSLFAKEIKKLRLMSLKKSNSKIIHLK